MSVAKVRTSSNSDPVKLEGHGSFDKFITQATGREPFLSFTRTNDVTTTTWDQLLSTFKHLGGNTISNGQKVETGVGGASTKMTKSAVETVTSLKIPEAVAAFAQAAAKANSEPEKYLPGWPLLSPSKFQLKKCTKCSLEFCSSVNYKRHIRTHRKSNIHEKASPKSREFLASFWDKISVDESRELVSLKDSTLTLEVPDKVQKVAASSIIARLASSVRKPGFSCLPHVYAKAGMTLLDVIQANTSVFPISSQELFKLLDEASEKTFLCAGSASSLLRFLLDGDVENIVLDMKNIVACTSLLLELELFKAWHADKDAEALRCQKLLVEEEEAAQKRRVGLTERRRRKKLRQKELKAKDNTGVKDLTETCDSTSFMDSLAPRAASDVELDSEASSSSSQSCFAASPLLHFEGETDGPSPDACDQNDDLQMLQLDGQCDLRTISDLGNSLNSFPSSHVAGVKGTVTEKNYVQKTSKSSSLNVGQKVWTRKVKYESQDLMVTAQSSTDVGSGETLKPIENHAVLIGTISVSLGDCVRGNTMMTCQSDLPVKTESNLNNAGRSIVKLWRPVSRQGKSDHSTCQNNIGNCDVCNEMADSSLLDKKFPSDGGGNDVTRMDSSMLGRTENASRPIMKLWRPVSRQGERDYSACQSSNSENRDFCKEGRICSGGSFFDETTTSSQPKSFHFSNDGGDEVSPDRRDPALLECTEPSVSSSHISEAHLNHEKFHQSSCRHGMSDSSTCPSDDNKSGDVCCELTISFESNVCIEVSSSLQDNFCPCNGGGDDAGHVRMQLHSSMLESTELAAPLLPSLIANSIERRWNQAIASDHVKWAHTCARPMDCPYTRKEGNSADIDIEAPDCSENVNGAAVSVQQAAALSGLQKFKINASRWKK